VRDLFTFSSKVNVHNSIKEHLNVIKEKQAKEKGKK
jgi:hypothetical protein